MFAVTTVVMLTELSKASTQPLVVQPVAGRAWVEVRAPELSADPVVVRLPEHIVTLEGLIAEDVVWEPVGEGRWRYHWQADQGLKLAKQTDFEGEVVVGDGELAFTFRISNPSTTSWGGERYNAFDVVAGRVLGLRDEAGERTYIVRGGRFVSVKEALGGEFRPGEAGWMVLGSGPHEAPEFRKYDERLMARTAADGQWVLGIASDTGDGATFNLDPDTSCLHQNRQWKPLQAGETRTLRGKVYLFRGGLPEFWARYERDKAEWSKDLDVAELQGRQTAKEEQAAASGYLPTVWAPPTASPTLARLAELRPEALPEHPLAAWVADVLARDTGRSADPGALAAALGAFKRQEGFWVRRDGTGLWVSNGEVGLALGPPDEQCAVRSLYHLPTRTECLLRTPSAGPPWRLQRYEGGTLVEGQAPGGPPTEQVEVSEEEALIRLGWRGDTGVALSARLTRGSPLVSWRGEVSVTEGGALPYTLSYPVLRGLGAEGENDVTTTWGSGRGQLFRAARGRLWNSDCRYPDSNWTTQMLSMSFGRAVLYLACHDGDGNTKSFLLEPGAEFHFTHYVPQPRLGETTSAHRVPYDVVIGPLRGDWYDAARQYRSWAVAQPWCRQGTLAERAAAGTVARRLLEAPFVTKPNWVFGDGDDWSKQLTEQELWGMEHLNRDRDLVGREVPLIVWWYGWENERFDDDTPRFTPREGVPEAFRAQAAEGLVVKPYTQSLLWDTGTEAFGEEARAAVCRDRNGQPQIAKWHWCEAASMCLSQPLCRETTVGLADQLAAIGANAIYLDAFPVMRECWDPAHGHPLGYGGNWWSRSVRAILQGIKARRGSQFGVMQEYFSEPYLDLVDVQMSWWYVEEIDCPVVPAMYSSYAVLSGSHTHKHYPDDVISFRIKQGRTLFWGSQLGRSQFSDYLHDEQKAAFMRQAVRLRWRLTDLLTYGEMLRPPRLLGDIPRVQCTQWNMAHLGQRSFEYDALEAALWRGTDGTTALLLANYDDQPHAVRVETEDWVSADRDLVLVTAEGETAWAGAAPDGEALTVELPAASVQAVCGRREG